MSALKRWWPLAMVALALAIVVARFWAAPPYSPDSWAYFELSRSLWSDGYVLGHLRVFAHFAPDAPSASFPPLWPLAWSAVSAITGLGARSGLLLAAVAAFAFIAVSEATGRAITGTRWIGTAAALFVLLTPGFFDETVGARAIPAQLAIVSAALYFALRRPDWRPRDGAVLGALAGTLVMLRFDMLPFAIVLGAGSLVLSRSWKVVAAFLAACLVVLAPWLIVSRYFHGVWFASDSLGVALSVDPARFVTDWYPPGQAPPTAFDQPAAFVEKVGVNTVRLFERMARSLGRYGSRIILAAAGFLVLAAALRPRPLLAALKAPFTDPRTGALLSVLAVFTAAALAMLPAYLLSGYFDGRYFSLLIWLGCLGLGWALASAWRVMLPERWLERAALAAGGMLVALVMVTRTPAWYGLDGSAFPAVPGADSLASCLRVAGFDARASRVLVAPVGLAARISAVHGIRTSLTPSNLRRNPPGPELAREFFRTHRITFVAGDSGEIAATFPAELLEPVRGSCGMPLYSVR